MVLCILSNLGSYPGCSESCIMRVCILFALSGESLYFVSVGDSPSCIQGTNSDQRSVGCGFRIRSALCQSLQGCGSVHVCFAGARLAGWWSVPFFHSHLPCAIRVRTTLVPFRSTFLSSYDPSGLSGSLDLPFLARLCKPTSPNAGSRAGGQRQEKLMEVCLTTLDPQQL